MQDTDIEAGPMILVYSLKCVIRYKSYQKISNLPMQIKTLALVHKHDPKPDIHHRF